MIKKIKNKVDYLIIFILSLVPLLWYRPGYMINGGDTQYPLKPIEHLYKHFFTWDPSLNTGVEASRFLAVLTFTFERYIFQLLPFPFNFNQVLSFIPFFLLAGIFFYLLMKEIYDGPYQRVVALLGVVFYLFNQYAMSGVVWVYGGGAPAAAAVGIAATLLFVIRTLKGKYTITRGAFYTTVASLLSTSAAVNPPFTFVAWLPLAALLFYEGLIRVIARDLKSFIFLMKFTFVLGVFFVLINAYWLLPAAYGLAFIYSTYSSGNIESLTYANYLIGFSKDTSILNTMRMQGGIDWYESHRGEEFVSYAKYYLTNPFLIIASFMLPILAYSAVIFRRHHYTVFFLLLAMFSTINAVGPHDPFKEFYNFLQENTLIYKLIRSPWYKFVFDLTLSYAVLIPIAVVSIASLIQKRLAPVNKRLSKLVFASIILAVASLNLYYVYPLLNGDLFSPERRVTASIYTSIPSYILDFSRHITAKKDSFRVVSAPFGDQEILRFSETTAYQGPNPILYITSPVSVLYRLNGSLSRQEDQIREQFQKEVLENKEKTSLKLMGLMNAKYVLMKFDINDRYYNSSVLLAPYNNSLHNQTGLIADATFDKWQLYRLDPSFHVEKVYTPTTVIIEDDVKKFSPTLEKIKDVSTVAIIGKSDEDKVAKKSLNSPNIKFQKINNTKYRVYVKNATGPTLVTFAESFSPMWKAYLNPSILPNNQVINTSHNGQIEELSPLNNLVSLNNFFKQPLNEETHIKTNGFGNGWVIEKSGDYTVDIEYDNQKFVYIGIIITLLSLAIISVWLYKQKYAKTSK